MLPQITSMFRKELIPFTDADITNGGHLSLASINPANTDKYTKIVGSLFLNEQQIHPPRTTIKYSCFFDCCALTAVLMLGRAIEMNVVERNLRRLITVIESLSSTMIS